MWSKNYTIWTYSKPCSHFLLLSRGARSKELLSKADKLPETIRVNQSLEQEVLPRRQACRPLGSPLTANGSPSCALNSCLGPNCGLSSSPQPDLRVVFFFLPYIDHFPGTILPPKPLIVTLRVSLSAHPNTILRKLFYQSTVLILHYQTSLTFDLRVLMYCYLINGQCALIKCSNVVIF